MNTFSIEQQSYRAWKVMKLEPYLSFKMRGSVISSKVDNLWSKLEPLFYKRETEKGSRIKRLPRLNDLHSLATVYMDDGSLMISSRVNHRLKKVYVSPHLALYLQNFNYDELHSFKEHMKTLTSATFMLSRRPDGNGYYLRTFKTADTLQFLQDIHPITNTCPTMSYKTNWPIRFYMEKQKWKDRYADYEVLASSRERMRPYTDEEIQSIIDMKQNKYTDQQIADQLNRSYWAIVYKISDYEKKENFKTEYRKRDFARKSLFHIQGFD